MGLKIKLGAAMHTDFSIGFDKRRHSHLSDLTLYVHRFQPTQLWGVLWGLARMAHAPDGPWMDRFFARSQQLLRDFTPEGLAHMGWALASLGYVPEKLWLRAFCGMCAYKMRWVNDVMQSQTMDLACLLG